jgi:hypothetical protein
VRDRGRGPGDDVGGAASRRLRRGGSAALLALGPLFAAALLAPAFGLLVTLLLALTFGLLLALALQRLVELVECRGDVAGEREVLPVRHPRELAEPPRRNAGHAG